MTVHLFNSLTEQKGEAERMRGPGEIQISDSQARACMAASCDEHANAAGSNQWTNGC